jgi:hypothetical protein
MAFGQTQTAPAFEHAVTGGAWSATHFVWPLVFLAGAGLLLGLIGTLRFSPLGAVLTGVFYIGSYVAFMVDGKDLFKLVDKSVSLFNHKAYVPTPIMNGTTLILGSLLLVAVGSLTRWRRPATEPQFAELPPLGESTGTDETNDFWTPSTPLTTPLAPYGEEASTEQVVPGQFGSPWRTPPGENSTEGQPR